MSSGTASLTVHGGNFLCDDVTWSTFGTLPDKPGGGRALRNSGHDNLDLKGRATSFCGHSLQVWQTALSRMVSPIPDQVGNPCPLTLTPSAPLWLVRLQGSVGRGRWKRRYMASKARSERAIKLLLHWLE